jgi:hypothetical protein
MLPQHHTACPDCGGPTRPISALGAVAWNRCLSCGAIVGASSEPDARLFGPTPINLKDVRLLAYEDRRGELRRVRA